jgi:hypothetical protein
LTILTGSVVALGLFAQAAGFHWQAPTRHTFNVEPEPVGPILRPAAEPPGDRRHDPTTSTLLTTLARAGEIRSRLPSVTSVTAVTRIPRRNGGIDEFWRYRAYGSTPRAA